MSKVEIFGLTISPWLLLPLLYFVWVTTWLTVKKILFRVLQRFASKTKTRLDDLLIDSADFPLTLFIFSSGAVIVEKLLPLLKDTTMTSYFVVLFKAVSIIATVLFLDKFLNNLMKEYNNKVELLRTSGGVLRGFVRGVVICLGILVLLDSFGVSITPILASLGIGSLAIALALQPTLENLFSGVQIVVDKPFLAGHFIKLESGEEGYVEKIGWRSTWVRMLPNNIVVMPNKLLVNSKIINYYYPDKELAVLVEVGVHYESDLEKVERVTIEVARETLKAVPGSVTNFDPFIRYHAFADFSINFSVILRAQEFVDHFLIKHEFIKRLHKRYAQEGITIPYPIQAINFDQEKKFGKNELPVKNAVD
jgi:small-conductance mechanosensitive channel